MRYSILVAIALLGCKGGDKAPAKDTVVDLASLDAARTAFNAHRGEVRFLTLLSPT